MPVASSPESELVPQPHFLPLDMGIQLYLPKYFF